MSAFAVGNIVELKSGGPKMTVTHVGPTAIRCVWFEGTKKMQGDFPPDALQIARAVLDEDYLPDEDY